MISLNEKYRLGSENHLPIIHSILEPPIKLNEVMNADPSKVCGIKIFMGSSTGNMLVDDEKALQEIFQKSTYACYLHIVKMNLQ